MAPETIVSEVREIINQCAVAIVAAAREQSTDFQESNAGVNVMDRVTQENAMMVQPATEACRDLAEQEESFNELLGQSSLDHPHDVRRTGDELLAAA